MGGLVIAGGFTGLRLPETLHHKLPQTLEEGEIFGKDFTLKDCMHCVSAHPEDPVGASYLSLPKDETEAMLELNETISVQSPQKSFAATRARRQTMKKLARQQSVMNTQKSDSGAMQLTYWF